MIFSFSCFYFLFIVNLGSPPVREVVSSVFCIGKLLKN